MATTALEAQDLVFVLARLPLLNPLRLDAARSDELKACLHRAFHSRLQGPTEVQASNEVQPPTEEQAPTDSIDLVDWLAGQRSCGRPVWLSDAACKYVAVTGSPHFDLFACLKAAAVGSKALPWTFSSYSALLHATLVDVFSCFLSSDWALRNKVTVLHAVFNDPVFFSDLNALVNNSLSSNCDASLLRSILNLVRVLVLHYRFIYEKWFIDGSCIDIKAIILKSLLSNNLSILYSTQKLLDSLIHIEFNDVHSIYASKSNGSYLISSQLLEIMLEIHQELIGILFQSSNLLSYNKIVDEDTDYYQPHISPPIIDIIDTLLNFCILLNEKGTTKFKENNSQLLEFFHYNKTNLIDLNYIPKTFYIYLDQYQNLPNYNYNIPDGLIHLILTKESILRRRITSILTKFYINALKNCGTRDNDLILYNKVDEILSSINSISLILIEQNQTTSISSNNWYKQLFEFSINLPFHILISLVNNDDEDDNININNNISYQLINNFILKLALIIIKEFNLNLNDKNVEITDEIELDKSILDTFNKHQSKFTSYIRNIFNHSLNKMELYILFIKQLSNINYKNIENLMIVESISDIYINTIDILFKDIYSDNKNITDIKKIGYYIDVLSESISNILLSRYIKYDYILSKLSNILILNLINYNTHYLTTNKPNGLIINNIKNITIKFGTFIFKLFLEKNESYDKLKILGILDNIESIREKCILDEGLRLKFQQFIDTFKFIINNIDYGNIDNNNKLISQIFLDTEVDFKMNLEFFINFEIFISILMNNITLIDTFNANNIYILILNSLFNIIGRIKFDFNDGINYKDRLIFSSLIWKYYNEYLNIVIKENRDFILSNKMNNLSLISIKNLIETEHNINSNMDINNTNATPNHYLVFISVDIQDSLILSYILKSINEYLKYTIERKGIISDINSIIDATNKILVNEQNFNSTYEIIKYCSMILTTLNYEHSIPIEIKDTPNNLDLSNLMDSVLFSDPTLTTQDQMTPTCYDC